jgi:hypothetical protein
MMIPDVAIQKWICCGKVFHNTSQFVLSNLILLECFYVINVSEWKTIVINIY